MSHPWHAWYKKFAPTSPEVRALYILEPKELPEWAIKLRQEFPTVPPSGVEMCHARWPETLDRLMDDVADGVFRRRAHWCGDIPLETVAGLGLRRRVLIAWLQGVKREKLLAELAEGLGSEPVIADLLYDVLGEVSDANAEVRQDIEFIADLFSGPYEAGNAPIFAKWKARLGELEGRKSILADLAKSHYPVLTNLCNYRTLGDVDRLIGMISRQMISFDMIGPCNWSLKFILQDEPERLSSSIAVVWSLHRYAADEFQGEVSQTPLGVRDQCNALLKRLGHSDDVRAWLAASLGFLVKKWVRRCWHIMEIEIPEDALPDFSFPAAPKVKEGIDLKQIESLQTVVMTKAERHAVVSSSGGSKSKSKAPSLAPSLSDTSQMSVDSATPPATGDGDNMEAQDGDSTPHEASISDDSGESGMEVPVESIADAESSSDTNADLKKLEEVQSESDDDDNESVESGADWDAAVTVGGTTRVLSPGEAGHEGEGEGENPDPPPATEGD